MASLRAKKKINVAELDLNEGRSQANQLTQAEWEAMAKGSSFTVTNSEGKEYRFQKHQVVAILPHTSDPKEQHELSTYWVAKIKGIRARKLPNKSNDDVWAEVQWYYSGKDVIKDVGVSIKAFNPDAVSPFERLYGDQCDFVHSASFEQIIAMFKFSEVNPEQMYIPDGSFYHRYDVEHYTKVIRPKPGNSTCICNEPYNPNDIRPASLMHFCPRPDCRRAYHQACLFQLPTRSFQLTVKIPSFSGSEASGSVIRTARKHASPLKKKPLTSKASHLDVAKVPATNQSVKSKLLSGPLLQLLSCSPETDEAVNLEAMIPHHSANHRTSLDSILATIPVDLLRIAVQPLVRGGAFVAGGVAGNIGMVTKARKLVYSALEMGDGEHLAMTWEDTVFGVDREVLEIGVDHAIVQVTGAEDEEDEGLPPLICPRCKSAI